MFIFILSAAIIDYVLYQIVMIFCNPEDKPNPTSGKVRVDD
jgi:hypothetical protein